MNFQPAGDSKHGNLFGAVIFYFTNILKNINIAQDSLQNKINVIKIPLF